MEQMEPFEFRKFIRPGALIFTLVVFVAVMLADGNIKNFTIRDAYLDITETILTTMIAFYFSSRGIEKITQMNNERKEEDE